MACFKGLQDILIGFLHWIPVSAWWEHTWPKTISKKIQIYFHEVLHRNEHGGSLHPQHFSIPHPVLIFFWVSCIFSPASVNLMCSVFYWYLTPFCSLQHSDKCSVHLCPSYLNCLNWMLLNVQMNYMCRTQNSSLQYWS